MTELTTIDLPGEGNYEYALRLPEANPFGKAKPHYQETGTDLIIQSAPAAGRAAHHAHRP